jgi:hypothetical protein
MGGLRSREVAFGFAALAASLLPRLGPILAGTCFADDFIHLPSGHLLSYRFLNWAELALWQAVFGPDYLLTSAPKIVGALYSTAVCLLLRRFLLRCGTRETTAIVVPLALVLHPLWNVFIALNVATVYLLSLVCILGGYLLLMRGKSVPGIVTIALGVSGYQVHAGLLPALMFLEWFGALRTFGPPVGGGGGPEVRKAPPWRRLIECAASVLLYLAVTRIAALAGLDTWGSRGLGLAHFREQFHAAMDNLATITQPLLSFYLGTGAAWRAWTWPFLLLAVLALLFVRRWPAALAPLALPALAALIILPLNTAPTGPRVAAAIWMATLLAVVPLLDRGRHAWIGVAVIALLALPIALADNANRVRAWRQDLAVLDVVLKGGAKTVVVRNVAAPPPAGRPIVMQNFQPVTERDYSNTCHWAEWFFAEEGIRTGQAGTVVPCPTS